jgi:hypothetical protein
MTNRPSMNFSSLPAHRLGDHGNASFLATTYHTPQGCGQADIDMGSCSEILLPSFRLDVLSLLVLHFTGMSQRALEGRPFLFDCKV